MRAPVIRVATATVLALQAALASAAPLQCAWRRPPELVREDSPGEALWMLAERFGAQGNASARAATLGFLVERYPGSRFAERARDELRGAPGGDAARSAAR